MPQQPTPHTPQELASLDLREALVAPAALKPRLERLLPDLLAEAVSGAQPIASPVFDPDDEDVTPDPVCDETTPGMLAETIRDNAMGLYAVVSGEGSPADCSPAAVRESALEIAAQLLRLADMCDTGEYPAGNGEEDWADDEGDEDDEDDEDDVVCPTCGKVENTTTGRVCDC